MSARWPWSALGLEGEAALREVKRAYSKRLKAIDKDDPEAFQALRDAFAEAKAMAVPEAAPKARPNIRELAHGDPIETVDAPFAFELSSAEASKPEEPEAQPEPPLANPVIEEAPPAPQPEENASEAEYDHDGLDAFWRSFDRAIIPKKRREGLWDFEALEKLLAMPIAQDHELRRSMQIKLYRALQNDTAEGAHYISSAYGAFLEREFGWLSDGVALQRLLGYAPRLQEIIYLLRISQPKPSPEPTWRAKWTKLKQSYFPHKAVIAVIVMLVWTRNYMSDYALPDYITMFVVTALIARFMEIAVILFLGLLRKLARLLRIELMVFDLLNKIAPEQINEASRNPQYYAFLCFILGALLLCIFSI